MLPKRNRLNLKKDRFLKGSTQFASPFFKLLLKKSAGDGPKIGFIVSGKVGKAASRNRVKRLLSEAAASKLEMISEDALLIFIAFPASGKAGLEEIKTSVDDTLSKAKILKGGSL